MLVVPVVALAVVVAGHVGPAAAAPADLEVDQKAIVGGVEVATATVPSGTTLPFIVKYKCASSVAACENAQISVPFPGGLAISGVSYPADVASMSAIGSQLIFTMVPSLAAGTTGTINLSVTVPDWSTPDGAVSSWTATMGASNASTVSSAAVSLSARADIDTSAAGAVSSGGALEDTTTYSLQDCRSTHSPSSTYGHLAIAAGSVKRATLPAGAVLVDADGGTVVDNRAPTPDTVTWTLPQRSGTGCAGNTLIVRYPSSDPANTAGAAKTVDLQWSGRKLGTSSTAALGNASVSHTLTAPIAANNASKSVSGTRVEAGTGTPTAAVGDPVAYRIATGNTGTATWQTVVAHDSIPAEIHVTSIGVTNPDRAGAEVWIASLRGADGNAGTSDDGQLRKAADVPAGQSLSVDPYSALPSGGAPLVTADWLTEVEFRGATALPGAEATVLILSGDLPASSRTGSTTTLGTSIANTATFDITTAAGPLHETRTATLKVDQPTPVVTVRNPDPPALAAGVRETDLTLTGFVSNDDMADPAFMVEMAPGTSLISWSGQQSPTANPATATLTQVDNWNGTGRRLLRWTFPAGSSIPRNSNYTITYRVRMDRGSYTSKQMRGYVSSRTQVPGCGDNYFDGAPDTADRDNDGNTTEVNCPWFATISLQPTSSALLTQSVKGSWNTTFADGPANGYTTPGSHDTYRLTVESQATMNLDQAVVINVLPRPGDTAVLSSAPRNPAAGTFPVYLDGTPVTPTLNSIVQTSYSVAANPCRPELNYSPAGCNPPAWSTTPPATMSDVTALKFDFGNNVLPPGETWTIDLPVTTPASGATEPDFAVINPSASDPVHDEIAYSSSGFVIRRTDLPAMLLPSEAQRVGLKIPSTFGPPGTPPSTAPLSSTGVGVAPQHRTVTIPSNGGISLRDGLTPVSSLTVPGEGSYTLDANTGEITFTPVLGFAGAATPAAFRVSDVWGQAAIAAYTPTVTPPAGPSASALTSFGTGTAAQSRTAIVPVGGSIHLLDGTTPVTTLTVPSVGTYTVVASSGLMTFTPAPGFAGAAGPATYQASDAYGQTALSTYTPTVAAPAGPTAAHLTSTGAYGAAQNVTVTPPAGGSVALQDGGSWVTSLTVLGQGHYVVNAGTGVVTFTPSTSFSGTATPVTFRVSDPYGQTALATLTVTVSAPAPPPAAPTTPTPTSTPTTTPTTSPTAGPTPTETATPTPTTTRKPTPTPSVNPPKPIARKGQVTVPKSPKKYTGKLKVTRAIYTSHSGADAHPIAQLGNYQLRKGEAASLSGDALFEFDSPKLTKKGHEAAKLVVRNLNNAEAVTCEGYTDYAGQRAHEMTLSEQRAQAVCKALKTYGAKVRTKQVGYGPARPAVVGGTARSRKENRRVVVIVTG